MLNKVIESLVKAGYTVEKTEIRINSEKTAQAVFVMHNYEGLYPDRNAYSAHLNATKIANKHGLYAEPRGYFSSTLIY